LACPNPTITEDRAMTTASPAACQRVNPRSQPPTLPASYTMTGDTTPLRYTSDDPRQVAWPSGLGVEYGVVDLPIGRIADLANAQVLEDDGVLAVVLDPGPWMPITFISEPAIAGHLVAIIADRNVHVGQLQDRVVELIGNAPIRWHDPVELRA
jgi:hypothetical protein